MQSKPRADIKECKYYSIKPRADHDYLLCPLCSHRLGFSEIGEYCTNKKCYYVDGTAFLNRKEYLKYKDKIVEE
jgi:hypothetical protein